MRHMLFRTTVPALVATAVLGAGSTAAFANDCFNPSRNPTPAGGATVIPRDNGDVFSGNYTNGASDELGGKVAQHGAGFCSTPNRDYTTANLHGIQVPEGCHWGE